MLRFGSNSSRSFWALLGLFFLVMLPLVAVVVGAFKHEYRRSGFTQIQVPVSPDRWKSLYFSREDWVPKNFADPSNPSLWQSSTDRGSAKHLENVNRVSGGVLWLGARFSEQDMARAFFTQSNVLFLGYVAGRYRIYLDGEPVLAGAYTWQSHPITIPVSLNRLESGQPLHLAIEIAHDAGADRPDTLGQALGEGWTSPPTADVLVRRMLWQAHTKPILCSTVLTMFAIVFFLGWLRHPERQHYAFFAIFVFHQSLIQMVSIDLVVGLMDFHFWKRVESVLLIGQAVTGLLIALAFAKMRQARTYRTREIRALPAPEKDRDQEAA